MSDNYTFPKKVRLIRKTQFQEILAKEPPVLEKFFAFYYQKNGLMYPRLGIITAKKKFRLAVLRNRIKRQVRESFRHYRSRLPGIDMVIVARQGTREASQCELRQCLDNGFLKLIGNCSEE